MTRYHRIAGALFAVLFYLFSYRHVQASCTVEDVNALKALANELISNITSATTLYTTATVDADVQNILSTSRYTQCTSFLNDMASTASTRYETIFTDECRISDTGSNEYQQNPCCNHALLDSDCCIAKTVEEVQPIFRVFKDPLPACSTPDPEETRARVRHHLRSNDKRDLSCKKRRDEEIRKLKHSLVTVKKCATEIMREDIACRQNSDCYSGVCLPDSTSKPTLFTCAPASHALDASDALAKCIQRNLPSPYLRIIQKHLGLSETSTVTSSALQTALKTSVSVEKCVNENVNGTSPKVISEIVSDLTTSTACLDVKKCSDGADSCKDSAGFCGAFCGTNDVCREDTNLSQSDCENPEKEIGTCINDAEYHSTIGFNTLVSQASCTSNSFCTAHCPGCSEVDCKDNAGYCLGFPFTGSRCVLPFQTNSPPENFIKCPDGTTDIGFGCLSSHTSSNCASAGGKWVGAPSSQPDCEKATQDEDVEETQTLFIQCVEGDNRRSSKSRSNCSKCNFSNQPLFQWVSGDYVPGIWTRKTKWLTRSMKSIYRWTQTLDSGKLDELFQKLEIDATKEIMSNYARCSLHSTFDHIGTIACSCEGGTNCYENNRYAIATFDVLPGTTFTHTFKDAILSYKGNTLSSKTSVSLSRAPMIAESRGVDYVPQLDPIEVKKGYVIGHGVQISSVPQSEDTLLCLPVDSQFSHVTTVYSTHAFGIAKDGKIERTDVPIEAKYNGYVCGHVKEAGTYYPLIVEGEYQPSAAYRPSFNAMMALALIGISMFIIF